MLISNLKSYKDLGVKTDVLTIGNFDGVHRGHQALLGHVRQQAQGKDAVVTVLTFEPHPQKVIRGKAPPALGTIDSRVHWLHEYGVDHVIVQPFDATFAALEPDAFLELILATVHPRLVVVGYDFRFGRGGRGDYHLVETWGKKHGIEVTEAESLLQGDMPVSSTRIRTELQNGNLQGALGLLGHAYTLSGVVQHGHKRGRTLGYPTANLVPLQDRLLPNGIYACTLLRVDDTPVQIAAACSYGTNPTFDQGHTPVFEAHLLDKDMDLYGKKLTFSIQHFLRPEQKFENLEDLKSHIEDDIARTRKLLRAPYNG